MIETISIILFFAGFVLITWVCFPKHFFKESSVEQLLKSIKKNIEK